MYIGFNLEMEDFSWIASEYLLVGKKLNLQYKLKIEKDLEKFKNADDVLDAQSIVKNWFPEIQSQVFLSHSHKDKDAVLKLAGWLKTKFNIDSFVDSTVWGYVDELLKIIDEKYCRKANSGNYDYESRNRSTSHVHMLLSTALMTMIDRCECLIFVNTPKSFKASDYISGIGKTNSPWIYNELVITKLIRRKKLSEHRLELANGQLEKLIVKAHANLKMDFHVELDHLIELNKSDLKVWNRRISKTSKYVALDHLYDMKLNCT